MSVRFISSNDIDRIKKSISKPCEYGANTSTTNHQNSNISRREQLKQLSSKRVSGWSDTLESTREAKLKWKREVQEREEEKRKEIDKEEEEIKSKLRANVIKRAKGLQYEQKEKVTFLRSQQLYTDVVETRKKQVEEKKGREQRSNEEERKWYEHSIKMIQETERKDKEKSMLQKKKALENAETMKKQRVENENNKKINFQAQRNAEEDCIRKAQAENLALEEQHRQRKINLKNQSKKEMEEILSHIDSKNEEAQKNEMEDEKKRQSDIARMRNLAISRTNLGLKHFEERQAAGNLLSDRAAEEMKLNTSRRVETLIKEQKEQELKEITRKEEEERLKKVREKEIYKSRKEQLKLRELRSKREIDDEISIAKQYQKMSLEALAIEKKKEYELCQKHNKMREFQLQQIEENQRIRKQEKEEHLLEAKKMTEQLENEDYLFREFAKKEMQRFKEAGKKTNLLEKALII